MGRKIAAGFLILFAVAQVPLSLLVLMALAGVMRDGPAYFVKLRDMAMAAGMPGPAEPVFEPAPRPDADDAPAPRVAPWRQRAREPKELTVTEGTRIVLPARESVEIEPLAPAQVPDDVPSRRIVDLPLFDPQSALGRDLAGTRDLAVDYVSVPPSRPRPPEGTPVDLRWRRLEGARLLLLSNRSGLSWWAQGDRPDRLLAVVVVAPKDPGDALLYGLPDTVPVFRVARTGQAFPFVDGPVPQCAEKDRGWPRFSCRGVRHGQDGVPRTAFDAAEADVRALLGTPIATVSAVRADRIDRAVLVPEMPVDAATRARAKAHLARYAAAIDAARERKRILQGFAAKWVAARRDAVTRELARHPVPSLAALAKARPQVLVVSAQASAQVSKRRSRDIDDVGDYAAYARRRDAAVGPIAVAVDTRAPTVVIASSNDSVDWRFDVAAEANVVAVLVEGLQSPTVAGVPDSIPLAVRSRHYGDADALGFVATPDKTRGRPNRPLQRLQQMFPDSEIVVHGDHKIGAVTLEDPPVEAEKP